MCPIIHLACYLRLSFCLCIKCTTWNMRFGNAMQGREVIHISICLLSQMAEREARPMSCIIQIHYAVVECQARSWDDKDVSNCQGTAYIQNMGYSYSIKYIPLLEENVNPFHHVFYDTYHRVRLKSVTLKSVTLPMPLIKWNTKIYRHINH